MKTGLIANPAKTSSSTHLETSWPDLVSTPRTIAYLHQSRRWLSVPWRGNWTCGQGRNDDRFLDELRQRSFLGRLQGDADVWMDNFDVFLFPANWGTRILKLRRPEKLPNAKTARL